VIPKPKYSKGLSSQSILAFAIIVGLLSVLSTIDLDHDPLLQTCKVDDVVSQRLLPTKLVTTELPQAKMAPQKTLSVSGMIA
jgi:hypothetical protein